jgi:hypothetical protein
MIVKTHIPLVLLLLLSAGLAQAQNNSRESHIGYAYPAGGCRGTTFEILLGGQLLRGASEVYVTGDGVKASVVKFYRPRRNLMKEQRDVLREKVDELLEKRWAEVPGKDGKVRPWRRPQARAKKTGKKDPDAKPVPLPEHPMLRDLEHKSLHELQYIVDELLNFRSFRKRQINTQLAEMVVVKVTVAPDAPLGDREIRLRTASGLSNPLCFQIGAIPEINETEPNDPNSLPKLPALPPAQLPVVVNGQIMPGDVDRIPFQARKGQKLVVRVQARHLIPYLADAVPGWFQATVSLIGPRGEEVAFADDYQFDPDPVLFYDVPKAGVYELEIHDSIYRGREDFVYRVSIGELPFVTHAFPLGGKAGEKVVAEVGGMHLSAKRLLLDTRADGPRIRRAVVGDGKERSNEVLYAVDDLPETIEREPNDDRQSAQRVFLPRTLNGRIGTPDDVDVYCFRGKRHQEVVAEVMARCLRSPLDSLLRLTNAKGETVAWNDDFVRKEPGFLYTGDGLVTHHADSYLRTELPKDGTYYLHVSDTSGHGGEAFAYRVRLSEPQPDYALRVSPSTLNLAGGKIVPITIHALRRDGFDGPILLSLQGAPEGMVLSGGLIQAGQNCVRATVSSPQKVKDNVFSPVVEGKAKIGDRQLVRAALPTDDTMQAFLYRHLTPAEEMDVSVRFSRWRAQGHRDGQCAGTAVAGRHVRDSPQDSAPWLDRAGGDGT